MSLALMVSALIADAGDVSAAPGYVLLTIAALGSMTTIVVALINGRRTKTVRDEASEANTQAKAANTQAIANEVVAREVAAEVIRQMDTGNGHTIGEGVARIEEQIATLNDRVDAVEVISREARDNSAVSADALQVHLADIADDRQFLEHVKVDWDAVKNKVLGQSKKRNARDKPAD